MFFISCFSKLNCCVALSFLEDSFVAAAGKADGNKSRRERCASRHRRAGSALGCLGPAPSRRDPPCSPFSPVSHFCLSLSLSPSLSLSLSLYLLSGSSLPLSTSLARPLPFISGRIGTLRSRSWPPCSSSAAWSGIALVLQAYPCAPCHRCIGRSRKGAWRAEHRPRSLGPCFPG